jgi:hypothetical protein
MSKHQEQILGAAWAKPRGATTAAAGGGLIAGEIGARWAGKHRKGRGGGGHRQARDMKDLAEVFERAKSATV